VLIEIPRIGKLDFLDNSVQDGQRNGEAFVPPSPMPTINSGQASL